MGYNEYARSQVRHGDAHNWYSSRRSRPGSADYTLLFASLSWVSHPRLAAPLTTTMKRKQQHRTNAPTKTLNAPSQPVANDVTPKRPPRSASRIVFGLALSALLVLFNSKSAEQYVVCSSSQKIYTVDPIYPRVECMLVKGSRIGRVGSYCEFKHWLALFKRNLTHVFFESGRDVFVQLPLALLCSSSRMGKSEHSNWSEYQDSSPGCGLCSGTRTSGFVMSSLSPS